MRARLQAGFTLIEVMIVVAIVAILTSIALPAYNDYIRRGRISEAVGVLSAQRIRMEQYFQDNRTYVGACTVGTVAPPMPTNSSTWDYACPTASLTANGFNLTATGKASMTGFLYEVANGDVRKSTITVAGWPSSTTCWILNKNGTC